MRQHHADSLQPNNLYTQQIHPLPYERVPNLNTFGTKIRYAFIEGLLTEILVRTVYILYACMYVYTYGCINT